MEKMSAMSACEYCERKAREGELSKKKEDGLWFVLNVIIDVYYDDDAARRLWAPANAADLHSAILRLREGLKYGLCPRFTVMERESIRDAFRVARFFEWI